MVEATEINSSNRTTHHNPDTVLPIQVEYSNRLG